MDDKEEEPPPLSAVARASKSPLTPAVPAAASSLKPSFAGASASSSGAVPVAVAMVATSKDEEEKDDHPSPPHPCPGAGPDKYIVSSIAARPHGLIVVLRCFGIVRRRHVRPSGGVVHHRGPPLRRLDPAGVRVGRGGPPLWRQRLLQCPRIAACPLQLSGSAVSTSLLLRWL